MCFLLLLLLVTPVKALSSTPPVSPSPPSPSVQDPYLGHRVYARKAFDCEEGCKSSPSPQLCILECISPACVAQTQASLEVDDMSDPEKSRFHQTAKKCAVEEFAKVFGEKFGKRMRVKSEL